jgi:glycogen synthase
VSARRLLIVTPRFLPDMGGIERHVFEVGRRLAAAGMDVVVATTDVSRRRPRVDSVDGIAIERVPAWPRGRDYHVAPGLASIVTRGDWDVVHVQSWHTVAAPTAMLAALRSPAPYVVTPHGRGYASPLRRPFQPLQRRLLAPLLRRARFVVALTETERGALAGELRIDPDRIVVIPNGSDLAGAAAGAARSPGDAPRIVSVGRLERFKGHHRVIEALPDLVRTHPGATLTIVGSGPFEPWLRRRAAELGLTDRVTIVAFGMEDHAGLAAVLGSADAGVLLSEYETHPIAALEMLALGVPVVVADVGGMTELAHRGLVRAVPIDAPAAAVAEAVRRELGRRPQLPPDLLPSWDEVAEASLRVYERALAG